MARKLIDMTTVHGEPRPANLNQGWTVDDSTFGARLALVRQRMQWNIKEAARECGIPAASWGAWESGAMPRRYTEMCQLIANRTGANFMWLLAGPQGQGSPATTWAYSQAPIRPISTTSSRPRDSRPSGHPTDTGLRRTARLPRSEEPNR